MTGPAVGASNVAPAELAAEQSAGLHSKPLPLWNNEIASSSHPSKNDANDLIATLSSPLSPLRSPVVADWKAVGSPIGSETVADVFEGANVPLAKDGMPIASDETHNQSHVLTHLTQGQSQATSLPPTRACRQRAMSMIERSVFGSGTSGRPFTPFDLDLDVDGSLGGGSGGSSNPSGSLVASPTSTAATLNQRPLTGAGFESGGKGINQFLRYYSALSKSSSPDRHPAAPQVAQLPQLLHKDLGVDNAEEATELFKRSAMESPKDGARPGEAIPLVAACVTEDLTMNSHSPTRPHSLSSMPSLFGGKMPFGPTPMLFGDSGISAEANEQATGSFPVNFEERDKSPFELVSRRHSSLFGGSSDWINEIGGTMAEFSVDEYFMGSSGIAASAAALAHRRVAATRRHSISTTATLFPEFEEHLGSLSLASPPAPSHLESNLSPAAASFHYGRSGSLVDFMSSPDALDGYFGGICAGNGMGGAGSPHHHAGGNGLKDSAAAIAASFQLSSYRGPLYAIEFKAGRTEIFYVLEMDGKPQLQVKVGDLVIVEADRGEDLGKVTMEISVTKLKQLMTSSINGSIGGSGASTPPGADKKHDDIGPLTPELAALVHSKEIIPKRIHRLAQPADLKLLQAKAQEEAIAMVRCQSRIRQKKLPMEVVDAEYQWDRNKLTFYFCADRRIDFRELVRDLFRIYKTRIWMCAVDKASPRMILYNSTMAASGGLSSALGLSSASDYSPLTTPVSFSLGPNMGIGFASNFRSSSQPSPS